MARPHRAGAVSLAVISFSFRPRFSSCGKHGPNKSAFCLGFFTAAFLSALYILFVFSFSFRVWHPHRAGAVSLAVVSFSFRPRFFPAETGALPPPRLSAGRPFLDASFWILPGFLLSLHPSVFVPLQARPAFSDSNAVSSRAVKTVSGSGWEGLAFRAVKKPSFLSPSIKPAEIGTKASASWCHPNSGRAAPAFRF